MLDRVRALLMLYQINAIKAKHTVGTGEAYSIVKIRQTYESLVTPDVSLNETMNLCVCLRGVAECLFLDQFYRTMTPDNGAINISGVRGRLFDIPLHHENILCPTKRKVTTPRIGERYQPYISHSSIPFGDRFPRINYEVFKPYWSALKNHFEPRSKVLPRLLSVLNQIPGWLILSNSSVVRDVDDYEVMINDFFLSFSNNKPGVDYFDNKYEMYLRRRGVIAEQLERISLSAPPDWEVAELCNFHRLFRRCCNEQTINRPEVSRELAIAYILWFCHGRCNEEFIDDQIEQCVRSISRAKKDSKMEPKESEKIIFLNQYMIPCLLENKVFLIRYFNS